MGKTSVAREAPDDEPPAKKRKEEEGTGNKKEASEASTEAPVDNMELEQPTASELDADRDVKLKKILDKIASIEKCHKNNVLSWRQRNVGTNRWRYNRWARNPVLTPSKIKQRALANLWDGLEGTEFRVKEVVAAFIKAGMSPRRLKLFENPDLMIPLLLHGLERGDVEWSDLDDTPWQDDERIALAALKRGLDPAALRGKPYLDKEKFVEDARPAIMAKCYRWSNLEPLAGTPWQDDEKMLPLLLHVLERGDVVWSQLNGTPWQDDERIALAALKQGLHPTMLRGKPYLENEKFVKDAKPAIMANCNIWSSFERLEGTPWLRDKDVVCRMLSGSLDPTPLIGNDLLKDNDVNEAAVRSIRAQFLAEWKEACDNESYSLKRERLARMQARTNRLWKNYADTPWALHVDIVTAAVKGNIDVNLIGSNVFTQRDAVLEFFAQLPTPQSTSARERDRAKALWSRVPADVKADDEVAQAAFSSGAISFHVIPKAAKSSTAVIAAIKAGRIDWCRLPKANKTQIEFALACKDLENRPDFVALDDSVKDRHRLWAEYLCEDPTRASRSVWTRAPDSIVSNKALMLQAIEIVPFVAEFLHDSLSTNLDLLQSMLDRNPAIVAFLKRSVIERFPCLLNVDVLKRLVEMEGNKSDFPKLKGMLECSSEDALRRLERQMTVHHRSDLSFIVDGWVACMQWIPENLAPELCENEEVFLRYAEMRQARKQRIFTGESYRAMGPILRSNKAFLLRLCKVGDPREFRGYVGMSLSNDFELQVAMCARAETTDTLIGEEAAFRAKVHSKMRDYKRFFTFLCGVSSKSGSPLVMLNQGTDHGIKAAVASFLDFPQGEQLLNLIAAAGTQPLFDE